MNPLSHTRSNIRDDAGVALLFALFAALLVLAATALVVSNLQTTKQQTDVSVELVALEEAAKAGLDSGIERVWNTFFEQLPEGENPTVRNYRLFLDATIPLDAVETGGPMPVPGLAVPMNIPGTATTVQAVTVDREDDFTGSTLTFRAVATDGRKQRAATQTIRVGGEPFDGFEFAVLANNINCILCHADFRNLDLEHNNDPNTRPLGDADGNGISDHIDNFNTFDRIKIAALESLLVRSSGANSRVAGAVYTKGSLYDDSGAELAGLTPTSFDGWEFTGGHDNTLLNGKLVQDGSGNMTEIDLDVAGTVDGELDPWANLYIGDQSEGIVPDRFPAPYSDDGGSLTNPNPAHVNNRRVDDTEFAPVMAQSDGTVTGGIRFGVPDGDVYADTSLPTSSNIGDISGAYDGNLILVGTPDNPIILDGPVAINGDLVMKGVVRGRGQLKARRNVYVTGDVTYDDNAAQGPDGAPYGVHLGPDGTTTENLLAVVAGGSVLMGDYLTIRGKHNSSGDSSKYPDKNFSIDHRAEHISGTKNGETLEYGYFDPGAVDAGEFRETMLAADGSEVPRQGQQFSFTTSELMLFNKMELMRALDARKNGEDVTARFYGLRESQPDNVYIYDHTDEHAVRYDEGGEGARVKTLQEWVAELGLGGSEFSDADLALMEGILNEATTHYMNPQGNWLSEDTLRQAWWDDEMSRTSKSPFRFDGLLYSNNAIFSIAKSKGRHNSNQYGEMILRGAIISADLGMLVPGGLDVLYDRRVRDLLNLEDTLNVDLTRLVFRYDAVGQVAQGE